MSEILELEILAAVPEYCFPDNAVIILQLKESSWLFSSFSCFINILCWQQEQKLAKLFALDPGKDLN